MRLAHFVALALVLGCSRAEVTEPDGGPGGVQTVGSWSKDSMAPETSARLAQQNPSLSVADPAALDEFLAAAPLDTSLSTGEGGKTKIGTSTHEPGEAEPRVLDQPGSEPRKPAVQVGEVKMQAEMSTPSIEKAARAQLYWDMVQRCRDSEGKILPPEVITVAFNLDADGYIVASSISVTTSDARYEDAATCMRRELSGARFRGPAGARGLPTMVTAKVPSVD